MPADKLLPFAFGENLVRVLKDENGEPLFVAKDICSVLELTWSGSRISHVPEEWRGVTSVVTPGGIQEMAYLTEQGLYFFLARSDKPKALPFQKWLAGEVLPSIRKTGAYTAPGAILPEEAQRLKPVLRERVLASALQAARLVGASTQEEIDRLFAHYCVLVSDRTRPLTDEVRDFYGECCLYALGRREKTGVLYDAFLKWRKGGAMPSLKAFSQSLAQFARAGKSNVSVFWDVTLRKDA